MKKLEASSTPLAHSPIHLLHRAGQVAGDVFAAKMSRSEITPRQYAVLVTVAHNEGLSQTHLVELTGIDRSTLADVVRRMLKKGLLQRRRTKEDARAYAVKLTDEGLKILEKTEVQARHVDNRILEVLPPRQREQFLRDLTTIIEALSDISPEPDKENS